MEAEINQSPKTAEAGNFGCDCDLRKRDKVSGAQAAETPAFIISKAGRESSDAQQSRATALEHAMKFFIQSEGEKGE